MDLEIFKETLKEIISKYNYDISMDDVISLLINDYFGLDIIKNKEGYSNLDSNDDYEVINRDDILKDEDVLSRYNLLKEEFIQYVKDNFIMKKVFGCLNDDSLENVKANIKDVLPKYNFAVITIIRDEDNNLYLQRRGKKARDEFLKLEEVGGAFEESDGSFRKAMERELKEEVGDKATILVGNLIGGFINTKYDLRTDKVISWLFLLYESVYKGGELMINEPTKCLGYEKYKMEEVPLKELSNSSIVFNKYYYEYFVTKDRDMI